MDGTRQIEMARGLCFVWFGFRLHYRYRYRLSKMFVFRFGNDNCRCCHRLSTFCVYRYEPFRVSISNTTTVNVDYCVKPCRRTTHRPRKNTSYLEHSVRRLTVGQDTEYPLVGLPLKHVLGVAHFRESQK